MIEADETSEILADTDFANALRESIKQADAGKTRRLEEIGANMSDEQTIKIPECDLGVVLHTALRKACDSTPTSLVWNIINIIKQGWLDYLDLIRSGWCQVTTKQDAIALLKMSAEELKWGSPERATLKIAFGYFCESDWEGFAAYLFYEEPT